MNDGTINQRRCSVEGCTKSAVGRSLCQTHYYHWRTNGDPGKAKWRWHSLDRRSDLVAFLTAHRTVDGNGCWCWTRSRNRKGYGQIKVGGRRYSVHRVSAAVFNGFPIGSKLQVLHSCDNPPCFNPAHLSSGTNRDNVADRVQKGRGRQNQVRGERSGQSKLTDKQAIDIRQALDAGVPIAELARRFKVHYSTIHYLKTGRNWRHL